MVTKQNVGSQLTQPVKDIADWAFPLSEILERYLREQRRINFTEAAIVVQKSTSAYIFRLEDLYNKITVLQQPLQQKENGKTQKHCAKKSAADYNFENFHLVDMEKRVGRNIDMKDESDAKETIKLISRRFPELEDFDITQAQPPIYIYDVCGEVIGKKYDFRCNHAMDVNGTLVDQLIPDAPDSMLDASVKERRNSTLLTVEVHTPGTVSSGYLSSASISECQATNCFSPKDSDTNIANLDHTESEDLSDDYIIPESFEEAVAITNNDVSMEQVHENVNANQKKEIRPRKRSERLRRNLQLVSKVTENALKVKNSYSKSSASTKTRRTTKNAPQRKRKYKHVDSRKELNTCIRSVQDLLNNTLYYEAVEDDRLNLLGFRCSDSTDKELQRNTSDISRSPTPMHIETRADSLSPDLCADWDQPDMSYTMPDYQSRIEDKMNEIVKESNVKSEWEKAVAEWHRSLQPKLLEAEARAAFDLQEYESEIVSNLKESEEKKCDFHHVVCEKPVYEVSRYFLASLHLANAHNIEISNKEELGMELALIKDKTK